MIFKLCRISSYGYGCIIFHKNPANSKVINYMIKLCNKNILLSKIRFK